ncbi:MAG: CoA-binding protein [Chloroflexi bacterium]|nr:CoA-binding protein [Chloroflexota bacterium]
MRTIEEIVGQAKTIAVVGLSPNPERASYEVASYLKGQGYRIIPVNPTVPEVLGEVSYPDLVSIPTPVDVVDIFRRPEDIPPIVEQAIAIGARAVWMQLGIANEEAARRAREAGLDVVMDRCLMVEHRRLHGGE